MTDQNTARRKPKQERSRKRVDHLLDTAAQLFEEQGYEAVTTNHIAAAAGVPIGSLYQFFPNKESVLEALTERYIEHMRALMTLPTGIPITMLVGGLIDGLYGFEQTHAGFRELFLSNSAADEIHMEIVGRVDANMAHTFPTLNPDVRLRMAIACIAMVKGMMRLYVSPDKLPAGVALSEVKLAVCAYIRAVLVREKHPLPPDLAGI
jgi:AcrR family transcriptional regulator